MSFVSKMVEIGAESGQKATLVSRWINEICFGTLRHNLWGNFPGYFVWVCTRAPYWYSKFSSYLFRFARVI